jgi:catechol 2,3-dioxygenase-like lactoylglutathione lyase family enzyme
MAEPCFRRRVHNEFVHLSRLYNDYPPKQVLPTARMWGVDLVSQSELHFFQMSISSLHAERSRQWYADAFDVVPTGGMRPAETVREWRDQGSFKERVEMSALLGIAGADLRQVLWFVDQRNFFQFELFDFAAPPVRPRPNGWRPCDIGYTTIGIHVADLDAALARLDEIGTVPLTPPFGEAGHRRVCVVDLDGVLLELMEDDPQTPIRVDRPRADIPAAARSVTLSVPDIDRARRFWVETLGLREASDTVLHGPEHEALWGLKGASRKTMLLYANDFWVEVVQYSEPVGHPWPHDYRMSDQGIFNVGLASRDPDTFHQVCDRVAGAGYQMEIPSRRPDLEVQYVMDDQGFSVQINHNAEALDEFLGFRPTM